MRVSRSGVVGQTNALSHAAGQFMVVWGVGMHQGVRNEYLSERNPERIT